MYELDALSLIFIGLCYFFIGRRQQAYSRHETDAESPEDDGGDRGRCTPESTAPSILEMMGINERRWDPTAHQRRRENEIGITHATPPPSYSSLDLPPSYSDSQLCITSGAGWASDNLNTQLDAPNPPGHWRDQVTANFYIGEDNLSYQSGDATQSPNEAWRDNIITGSDSGAAQSSVTRRFRLPLSRVTPLDSRRLISSPPPAYNDVMAGRA